MSGRLQAARGDDRATGDVRVAAADPTQIVKDRPGMPALPALPRVAITGTTGSDTTPIQATELAPDSAPDSAPGIASDAGTTAVAAPEPEARAMIAQTDAPTKPQVRRLQLSGGRACLGGSIGRLCAN